jgi:hypothetical protein
MRGTVLTNIGDVKFSIAWFNNLEAVTDPTVNDDLTQGYSVGSQWVNIADSRAFVCVDVTDGAAVWNETGAGPAGTLEAPAGESVELIPGSGSVPGVVQSKGVLARSQGAPAAKTVSGTLTAADLLAGIVTINQGAGATSAQQLPTGTAIQDALPSDFGIGQSIDVSFINISTVDAEDASVTVNTDVTIVGSPDLPAHSGPTLASSGIFRIRKTADHVFVAYRIS